MCDVEETHSNASSTDDYVRELLDPDDRRRNVWRVVEGPKVQEDGDQESPKNKSPQVEPTPDIEDQQEQTPRRSSSQSRRDRSRHHHHRDSSRDRDRDRDRSDRSHHKDRSHDKRHIHERTRDRSPSNRSGDRRGDRDRYRHRSGRDRSVERKPHTSSRKSSHRERRRSSSGSRSRRHDRSRSNSQSPLTKRNSRTILIMQLSPRVDSRDLEDFFSDIGKVREVRLIMDSKTRRHKGIAYIEFEDAASAAKAYEMNGRDFRGAPMVIQSAQLDRNSRHGDWYSSTSSSLNYTSTHQSSRSQLPLNSYRVYAGGLHLDLTEDMLRSVFEPFGPILRLELMRDRATNVSRGYAFITFANIEDGQEAVEKLDGLELGGKPIKVSKSTDKSERHSGLRSEIS